MAPSQSALIVDDNERIAEMLAVVLGLRGFDVHTARNGVQGYASYFRNPVDWLITDVEMPGLNGVELVRCIRAIDPEVKVIYISGAVDDYRSILAREAHDFGAKVLRKPFTHDALVAALAVAETHVASKALWRNTRDKRAVKVA